MTEAKYVIIGEYIDVEEMPIGCVITDKVNKNHVVIGSVNDANLLIESLKRMKEAWSE